MQESLDDSPFAIPDWVKEHPVIKSRGIELEIVYKPVGPFLNPQSFAADKSQYTSQHVVWRSPFEPDDVPPYVVKIVKESSEEVEIYARLQQFDRASPNHTVPCEVIQTDTQRPLLIMPCMRQYGDQFFARWTITRVLDHFHQIVEVLCTPLSSLPTSDRTSSEQGLEFLHDRHIAHLVRAPTPRVATDDCPNVAS